MNKKICSVCGCSRKVMLRVDVQIARTNQLGLNWACFPCFFKWLTKTPLVAVDENLYKEFMQDA